MRLSYATLDRDGIADGVRLLWRALKGLLDLV